MKKLIVLLIIGCIAYLFWHYYLQPKFEFVDDQITESQSENKNEISSESNKLITIDNSNKEVWSSFNKAKKRARDIVYDGRNTTFYCGCNYEHKSASGGRIIVDLCDYDYRKSESRGSRLEWEHVVPASFFGNFLPCWTEGNPECKRKGRTCCAKVNKNFHEAEVDLHNLVPAVGEVNGDRSNHPFGIVEGEPRAYGSCDFEIGGDPKKAEPREEIRGNIARIWFYMIEAYDVPISQERLAMLRIWDAQDPIDDWEKERNRRIFEVQGNCNPFIETL